MASAGSKRRAADVPIFEQLQFTALGGGEEVGRSCLILRFKGKNIMVRHSPQHLT